MHRFRFLVTFVAIALGSASSLHSQVVVDTAVASEGSRVRLSARTLQNSAVIGTLTTIRPDSIWLRHDVTRPTIAFARSALTRLDVSGGHPAQARRALYGALVGGASGALLGAALGAGGGGCSDCSGGETGARTAVVGLFGLLGGFTGMLVGAGTSGPERWYPARLVPGSR